MTIPTLIPCPKPDCRTPVTHWHGIGNEVDACNFALNGNPCMHIAAGDHRCYAPRVRPERPLHLPDVDTTARVIYESYAAIPEWDAASEGIKDAYRRNARAVLDLIAAHQPVWKRVDPGTRVEKGQRYRIEYANGDAYELMTFETWSVRDDGTTVYFPRTVPAPETKDSIVREFAAELDRIYTERTAGDGTWMGVLGTLVNRLDALGGESA